MREQVKLVCTECKEENYDTNKNKKLIIIIIVKDK